jgi:hypothetical protein
MNKIDLIINALEKAKDGWQCFDEYEKALAAARELQELKPVAWIGDKPFSITRYETVAVRAGFSTPLYALDEVTK